MQQPPPLPMINPYAAPIAHVEDVQADQLVLADRGVRLAAAIIDGLFFGGAVMVVMLVAMLIPPGNAQHSALMRDLILFIGGGLMLGLLIVNLTLLYRNGQTIAKRLFGIRVVRVDGSRCALSRIIFARWLPVTLLGAIPLIGFVVGLVDPLMIFGQDQRCLHDQFADTIVVKV